MVHYAKNTSYFLVVPVVEGKLVEIHFDFPWDTKRNVIYFPTEASSTNRNMAVCDSFRCPFALPYSLIPHSNRSLIPLFRISEQEEPPPFV